MPKPKNPPASQTRTRAARRMMQTGPHYMSADEFTRAVNKLWRSVYASRVELGLSLRQVQRFASGERMVPVVVARLLRAYLLHGVPPAD